MRIMRTVVLIIFACVVSTGSETTPDFSGKWVLSKAKSKQRDPRQFKRQTMEVSQHDPDLDVDLRCERPDGGEFRAYLNFKTDGTPAVAILGAPQRAVIRWKGRTMVIRWNLDGIASGSNNGPERRGATPPFTWTWTLSADSNTLVNETHLYGDVTGDIVERLVFEKARPGKQP